jgi:hypothetical protein
MVTLPSLVSASTKWAVLAALLIGPAATFAAQPVTESAARTFKVGSRALSGTPKTVCIIEGTWRDGTTLRYEGWDTCRKMSVRAASLADYKGWKPRGRKGALTVADIPPEIEVIEIGNEFSSVLVFRDRNGDTKEVLIRD